MAGPVRVADVTLASATPARPTKAKVLFGQSLPTRKTFGKKKNLVTITGVSADGQMDMFAMVPQDTCAAQQSLFS